MIYTAIDTFYLTDEQLQNSPSRKDGIDEATETTLRIYGCDLIQESGILLKLPQAVMATGQRVAASCVWLASKLEESPRRARHVLNVFHRMECRRESLPIEHLDPHCKKSVDLKMELIKTERHILKEMGFICHVEHPHKFISNYLATLEAPQQLTQEAWNLANDRRSSDGNGCSSYQNVTSGGVGDDGDAVVVVGSLVMDGVAAAAVGSLVMDMEVVAVVVMVDSLVMDEEAAVVVMVMVV
ncbi:hypothetical protein RJ639_043538 [Escallonia herrerae]|uniref:Cyclin N-terminal domain-containing protein n=1 Tax=Escallonia herrerae TaxID=1293975 RepID=A0AA89B3L3_9ASTE|nr:hypothetical protein RJ639_043538 [Escallonia herrerae]